MSIPSDLKSFLTALEKIGDENIVMLLGPPGIGKSHLAREYSEHFQKATSDSVVVWISASSEARLELSLKEKSSDILLSSGSRITIQNFLQQFKNSSQKACLLVLDDFSFECSKTGSGASLLQIFQEATSKDQSGNQICILLTTQDNLVAKALSPDVTPVVLSCCSEPLAMSILRAKNPDIDISDQDASDLARLLEFLPLALVQAASYIHESRCSIREYVQLYNQFRGSQLLSTSLKQYADLPEPISSSFRLSFSMISSENERAIQVLFLMSTLDTDGIPETLLFREDEMLRPFHAAIRKLQAFSLIKTSEDGWTLYLDRLVRTCVQAELERQQVSFYWQQQAIKLLSQRFHHNDSSWWRSCYTLLPSVQRVLTYESSSDNSRIDRALLLTKIANFEEHLGRFKEAYQKLEEALGIYLADCRFNERSKVTIKIEKSMAGLLYYQGDFQTAEERTQKLLTKLEVLGNMDRLDVKNTLGNILQQQGKYQEAKKCFKEALAANIDVNCESHVDSLHIKNNLACLYKSTGKYEKAEKLHREVLTVQKSTCGPSHHNTIYTMSLLGSVITERGRYKDAAAIQEDAFVLAQRVLGNEHPDTLTIMNRLAIVSGKMGDFSKSESLLRQILTHHQAISNEDHPSVIIARLNLGVLLDREGKYSDAVSTLEPAVEPAERVLGEENPTTLDLHNSLALLHLRQGNFPEAEAVFQGLLDVNKKIYGANHIKTLRIQNNLAGCLQRQGQLKQAEILHKETMEGAARLLGTTHPFSLRSMNNVAEVLRELAELQKESSPVEHEKLLSNAQELQEKALRGRESQLGMEHIDTLTSALNLGQIMHARKEHHRALSLYRRALDRLEKNTGQQSPVKVACREKLALLEQEMHL